MARQAQAAVEQSIRALVEHDAELGRRVKQDDTILDQLEIALDDLAIQLLGRAKDAEEVRLITVAMKISRDLERIGDEATTIARRAVKLSQEEQLKPY